MEVDEERKKGKLDSLPDYKDKFWLDADNRIFETKLKSCLNTHFFTMTKKANHVKCECGIGFILSSGITLEEDGHIYFEDKLVI